MNELPDPDNVSNIDTALFTYEDAREMLLRSGALVEPGSKLGLIFGGVAIGAVLGGAAGYFITRRMLETKYNNIAEDEITEMRQHYRDKELSLENTQSKPELESIVRDRGYSTQPPMAVTPPDAVVDRAQEVAEEEGGDPRPPVPVVRDQNVFQQPRPNEAELGRPVSKVQDDWDYDFERSRRSVDRPYIIHMDEKDENDEYDTVTFTYYEEDDVVCNERDEVIDKQERDLMIGEAHLNMFGHGSGDPSIVYIRNDRLEMQMEVVRSPNSYAEEVHGFEPTPPDELRHHHRRERRLRNDE
jgi:hypothetical protein